MDKLEELNRDQLLEQLRTLTMGEQRQAALTHELKVHQVELEMQNLELRRAQGLLEDSRSKYSELFDFAPVGYCTLDAQGAVVEANLTMTAMVGVERARLIGRRLSAVVRFEDPRLLLRHIDECLKSGHQHVSDVVIVSGKQLLTVQLTSVPVYQPTSPEVLVRTVMQDVTSLKRNQQVMRFLAESADTMASSLEVTNTLPHLARLTVPWLCDLCIVDLLAVRDQVLRLEVAVQSPALRELAAALLARVPRHDGDTIQAEVMRSCEASFTVGVATGMTGATSMIVVPLASRGRALGALSFATFERAPLNEADFELMREIARRASNAVETAQLYQASRQAVRAREEVLAIVSHDLKDPLATTIAATHLLLRAPREEDRRRLEAIEKSSKRMSRLISDLLDLSTLDAGQLKVQGATHLLRELLGEAVETAQPLGLERNVSVELAGDLDMSVWGDRSRLLQVLANLLGNAVKFSPVGGRVLVSASAADGWARVSVRDQGPGIAPDLLPRLFERFARGADRSVGGHGLGLSIARGIVEAHGGSISVDSTPGQGSSLTFSVPLAAALEVSAATARPLAMVVDDVDDNRELLSDYLQLDGFEVLQAENGLEALRTLQGASRRPALILLDLQMPVMNGWQLMKHLQDDPNLRPIPVVLVSSQPGLAQESTALGAVGYLRKPIDFPQLNDILQKFGKKAE